MGCLEMGMVKTGKLRSAQTGYAIEQWEKAIAEASMVSGKLSSVEQASVENPGVSKQDGPTSPDRAPYIGNLAVSRNFRRLGVASSLVVEACQQAVQLWNSECVWLHVEARNEAASQLYRKLEFGCEAQDPDWMEEVGKRRRLLLRSSGGCSDWAEAKTSGVKLNGWEYVRWCWNDLARVKRERQ